MTDKARRDVLIGGCAVAIAGAVSTCPWTRGALGQTAESIAASEWDYRSVKELIQALQTRRISSVELLEHTIARIEALDRRLNAVVVRDFERAREAAKADSPPFTDRLLVARSTPLLPELADSARLYIRVLGGFGG